MSKRLADTEKEKAVAQYLDKFFYSRPCIREYSRKADKNDQLSGIDVTFKITHSNLKTDTLLVDEKSAVHYVNNAIPTFAFELQFQNARNIKTEGWLYDKNKQTTHYLLVWVETNREDSKFSCEDITKLEVMLISRDSIKQILDSKNFNITILDSYISKMLKDLKVCKSLKVCERQNVCKSLRVCYKGKISKKFDEFTLHYSGHLSEKSINVTIKKEDMKKKCMGHFRVTSTSVEKVI